MDPLLLARPACRIRCTGAPRTLQRSFGDGVGDRRKHFGHVVSCLRTGLKEQKALLLGVGLGLFVGYLARISIVLRIVTVVAIGGGRVAREIQFVTDEGDDDAWGGLSLQLGDPVLGLDEGRGLGQVVDNECGLSVPVVHGRERGKTLLACGIPDLKLDCPGGQVALLGEESGYEMLVRCRLDNQQDRDRDRGEDLPPIVGSLFS